MIKYLKNVTPKKFNDKLNNCIIRNNTITATDGNIIVTIPIEIDYNICVDTVNFVKAYDYFNNKKFTIEKTDTQLIMSSDNVTSKLSLIDISIMPEFTHTESERYEIPYLKSSLKLAQPFMGIDASRLWSMAVHYMNGKLYATNNISVCELWYECFLGDFDFTLPDTLVNKILEIEEDPFTISKGDNLVTIHYKSGIILSSVYNSAKTDLSSVFKKFTDFKEITTNQYEELVYQIKEYKQLTNDEYITISVDTVTNTDCNVILTNKIPLFNGRYKLSLLLLILDMLGNVPPTIYINDKIIIAYSNGISKLLVGITR